MTMLIAYDGSAFGVELLASARVLASAAGWPICVVAVEEPGVGRLVADDDSALAGLELHHVSGSAGSAILKAAEDHEAQIVALGLRSDDRHGFGHVALELLHHADTLLFVMRPGMRPLTAVRRVLVPMEGSPSDSAAMHVADLTLCAPGREIVMLHVVTGARPLEAGSMPAPRFVDSAYYAMTAWQREFEMRFSSCPHGRRHRVDVRAGDIGEVILAQATESSADLITITWKQSFEEGRALTARHVLECSPCPLLVIGQRAVATS